MTAPRTRQSADGRTTAVLPAGLPGPLSNAVEAWSEYAEGGSVLHVAKATGFVRFSLRVIEDGGRRVVEPRHYVVAFPLRDQGKQKHQSALFTLRVVREEDISRDPNIQGAVANHLRFKPPGERRQIHGADEYIEFELLSREHEVPSQQALRISMGPVRSDDKGQKEFIRVDMGQCIQKIATDIMEDPKTNQRFVQNRWWMCVETLRLLCNVDHIDCSALDKPDVAPQEWVIRLMDAQAPVNEKEACQDVQENRDIDDLMEFIDSGPGAGLPATQTGGSNPSRPPKNKKKKGKEKESSTASAAPAAPAASAVPAASAAPAAAPQLQQQQQQQLPGGAGPGGTCLSGGGGGLGSGGLGAGGLGSSLSFATPLMARRATPLGSDGVSDFAAEGAAEGGQEPSPDEARRRELEAEGDDWSPPTLAQLRTMMDPEDVKALNQGRSSRVEAMLEPLQRHLAPPRRELRQVATGGPDGVSEKVKPNVIVVTRTAGGKIVEERRSTAKPTIEEAADADIVSELLSRFRRLQERSGRAELDAKVVVVRELLEVLDELERADAEIEEDSVASRVLFSAARKFEAKLRSMGLHRIEALGKPFDGALHRAVGVPPESGSTSQVVVEELESGWILGEAVVRLALVSLG